MDTKLSVALLSGLSLFMSIGAFAVSGVDSSDELNWSYAMGETAPVKTSSTASKNSDFVMPTEVKANSGITCTAGCPARPREEVAPLTLTYEDEALPLAERFAIMENPPLPPVQPPVKIDPPKQKTDFPIIVRTPVENQPILTPPPAPIVEAPKPKFIPPVKAQPILDPVPQVNTVYVSTPAKTEYPVTHQYPISVQYPVTVQRNMTVEQPVIMQQPVVVRRPIVMQQDVTIQRQPTIIQHQPMIMQQQPAFVQQQPLFIQAPASATNPLPMTLPGFNAPMMPMAPIPAATPSPIVVPQQPMSTLPMAPITYPAPVLPQQYQVQGQIQAQPLYTAQPMYMPAPAPQPVYPQPETQPVQGVPQQPVYQN